MRVSKRSRLLSLLVAAAALAGPAAASAQDGSDREAAQHDPPAGEEVLDARAAAKADAHLMASQHDWKPELAAVHLEQSRAFTDLVADVAASYPKTYAGAVYAEEPGDASLLRFVGEPPEKVAALAERSRVPIKVVGDAKYSEQELQERAKAVHERLVRSGFEQVATATTSEDGLVATVFGKGDPDLPRDLSDGLELNRSREPIVVEEHTYGGARLLDDGVFECTSGFTVVSDTGTTGVATAAHCNGLNEYEQPSDGLIYDMTHQAQHYGIFGDAEWKTTPHVEPANFYARDGEKREVNSVSTQLPVNVPSCVYGRSSDLRACDDVYSNFVIATFNGTTHWFLMAMDSDNTIPGDSGGPWSYGTEADGIHKGDLTLGGGRRNIWSRADLLPAMLDVSVRTQ